METTYILRLNDTFPYSMYKEVLREIFKIF